MSESWILGSESVSEAGSVVRENNGGARRRRTSADELVVLQSGLALSFYAGEPAMPVQGMRRKSALLAKRVLDIALAALALVTLAPFLAIVALAVKATSPGPVLFRQQRVGFQGTSFEVLKFRSIRIEYCDESGITPVLGGDSRFTPIGEFLRKSSIDELPQLLNVLRGDMSLVGPRPHVVGQLAGGKPYAEVVPYYSLRWQVLPGLTGWAQANGLRGSTSDAERAKARIDHDIAYAQNLSLLLDARVLVQTIWRELFRGEALWRKF